MLEQQHQVIPKRPPRREVRDIISWIDCWIAYCQAVPTFIPSRSVELLKYLYLIVRTHRSFPSGMSGTATIVDLGGKPNAPRSLSTGGPLTWKFSPILRKQQRALASCPLAPVLSSLRGAPPGRRSPGLSSAAEICCTWNSGHCTSGFAFCRRLHECLSRTSPLHHVLRSLPPPPLPSPPRGRARRPTVVARSFCRSRYLLLVAVCRLVLRHFLVRAFFSCFAPVLAFLGPNSSFLSHQTSCVAPATPSSSSLTNQVLSENLLQS